MAKKEDAMKSERIYETDVISLSTLRQLMKNTEPKTANVLLTEHKHEPHAGGEMTDGDKLRELADVLDKAPTRVRVFFLATMLLPDELHRMAARLDEWDKELRHPLLVLEKKDSALNSLYGSDKCHHGVMVCDECELCEEEEEEDNATD